MRIRFITNGILSERGEDGAEIDLILCGLLGVGEISYEKELSGESDFFERNAKLSKAEKNVVVCGCITNSRGHKRKSALVAENGKLLGVSDMVNVIDGRYGSGAELRIYPTKIGKMGVVVGEDLYFSETVKSLVVCGSDFIVCPFAPTKGELSTAILRAHAFEFGVPIFFCGKGYCAIASSEGEIVFSSPQNQVVGEYAWKAEYHLLERRIRGKFS